MEVSGGGKASTASEEGGAPQPQEGGGGRGGCPGGLSSVLLGPNTRMQERGGPGCGAASWFRTPQKTEKSEAEESTTQRRGDVKPMEA